MFSSDKKAEIKQKKEQRQAAAQKQELLNKQMANYMGKFFKPIEKSSTIKVRFVVEIEKFSIVVEYLERRIEQSNCSAGDSTTLHRRIRFSCFETSWLFDEIDSILEIRFRTQISSRIYWKHCQQ